MLDATILEGVDPAKVEQITAAVTTLIEAEKQKGIQEKSVKSAEVKKWMTQYMTVKDTLKDVLGRDIEDPIEAIRGFKSTPQNGQNNPIIDTLTRQVKELTEKFTAKDQEATQSQKKLLEKDAASVLDKALGDNVAGKDLVISHLLQAYEVRRDESGNPYFAKGDETFEVGKVAENFLKTRPDLIRANERNGIPNRQPANAGGKTITREQWNNLKPSEKEAVYKAGNKII
jgi:hypothetical protein